MYQVEYLFDLLYQHFPSTIPPYPLSPYPPPSFSCVSYVCQSLLQTFPSQISISAGDVLPIKLEKIEKKVNKK